MDILDKQIELIKVSRMKTEEQILYYFIKESKIYCVKNKKHNTNNLFFAKNNTILFEYDRVRNEFYVDYTTVWRSIQDANHITVNQTNDIIKKFIKKYFNIDVIPLWSTTQIRTKWIFFQENKLLIPTEWIN